MMSKAIKTLTAGAAALLTFAGLSAQAQNPQPLPPHDGMKEVGKGAEAVLEAKSGSKVQGKIRFLDHGDHVMVVGQVTGLTPKSQHGFHIHEKGDCSGADAMAAGGHFNPTAQKHGDPEGKSHHVGDLGNLVANDKGVARINLGFPALKIPAIIGLPLIVHEKADDLKTDPSGNSGKRIACGVIKAE